MLIGACIVDCLYVNWCVYCGKIVCKLVRVLWTVCFVCELWIVCMLIGA